LQLLALDTSTEWCSAALWLDGELRVREENAGQRHSELILPMVDSLLREAGLALAALDAIAFGAGPGSFTGLRIACGVVQGMALGADLKVIPVSTLESLAQACGGDRVIAALDARMGELYLATYVREGEGWRNTYEPRLCLPQEAPLVEGVGWIGSGSGFAVHGDTLASRYGDSLQEMQPHWVPHARDIATLGALQLARGGGVDPALAEPLYVRDKVAMTIEERAARKAGTGEG